MPPTKTAALILYLDIFVNAGPFGGLHELFHRSLKFRGPLFSADSARDYIAALERDPPTGVDYDLLSSFEKGAEAVLVIRFKKPPKETLMSVWGRFSGNKINELRLIFDPGALR